MKRAPRTSNAKSYKWQALRLTLIYAVVAMVWILVSDQLVSVQILQTVFGEHGQTVKGLAFVLVTAGLLFLLLTFWLPPPKLNDSNVKPLNCGLIFTLAGLLSLVPIIAALIVFLQAPVLEKQTQDQLKILAQNKNHQLHRWYQERQADAQIIQNDRLLDQRLQRFLTDDDAQTPGEDSAIRQRLQDLYRFYQYEGVQLLDANYQTRLQFGRSFHGAISQLPALKQTLAKAAASGQIQATSFYHSIDDAHTHLDWVIPIQTFKEPLNTQTLGFILIHAGPEMFIRNLLTPEQQTGRTLQLALMHRINNEAYQPLFEQDPASDNFLKTPCFLEAIQPRLQAMAPSSETTTFCDRKKAIVAVVPFDATDWLLVAAMDRKYLLQELYVILLWVISLIIMSALGYAIWLLWRQQERLYQMQLTVSNNRLQHFLNVSPSVLYVLRGTADALQVDYVSPNIEAMTGFSVNAASDPGWWRSHLHEADHKQAVTFYEHALSLDHAEQTFAHEFRFYDKQGKERLIRDEFKIFDLGSHQTEVVGTWFDRTHEKAQHEQLQQAQVVYDASQEGIIVTDSEQRIINVNAAFERITGYRKEEVLGQTPAFLKSNRHDRDFYLNMWRKIKKQGMWRGEIWNRRQNGDIYPELLSITQVKDDQNQVLYYIGVFSDLSKLRDSQAELTYLSTHDPLTGLPNRQQLIEHLNQLLSPKKPHPFAVLMLDLNRFKYVNESLGHETGDALLKAVGKRLRQELSANQMLARFGGDEFVVVMPHLPHQEDAARLAEALIKSLTQNFDLDEHTTLNTNASIGISLYPHHGNDATTLIQNADAALHKIKDSTSNELYAYYTSELTEMAHQRIELEARLKQGLITNELIMLYQPQIDLKSGKIIGAEALIRWQHPEKGLIPPAQFIGLAEETGLIIDIGDWVLKTVCQQGREWLDQGLDPGRLAINLSSRQFQDVNVIKTIETNLANTLLPPHILEVEVTESSLMHSQERVARRFTQLQAMGISIAMDDFGTGYSSLAYLRNLPINVLKIDKMFTDGIGRDTQTEEILKTIITMGHSLEMKVLAEGVETLEQREFLSLHGADYYQGYYWAEPLSADAFAKQIRP
jgi:diguanylate cyclase (GGDEF)-like protein/PAS domain S-box-containing protein